MSFSHLFHFGQYVVFCRLPPLASTKYRTKSLLFKLIFTDKFSDFSFFIFTFATIFNHYKVLIKSVKFNTLRIFHSIPDASAHKLHTISVITFYYI